jgi:hypothetical protein
VTTRQFALDFTTKMPPAAQAAKADGMEAADAHADPFWKRVIDGCILAVARKQAELSVDNVLDEIEEANKGTHRRRTPASRNPSPLRHRASHETRLPGQGDQRNRARHALDESP